MNTLFKQTKTKKVISAFVGVAVSLTMVLPASAATAEELQAQISALLAQIASLQAQVSGSTSTTVGAYTFTKDLKLGSTGADVKALQKVLNSNPATAVATTGVGSAGMESEYFGAMTKAAVMKFQTANSIAPVAGYVGSLTRAKLNSMSTGTGTGTGTTVTGPVSAGVAAGSPTGGGLLAGQAAAKLLDVEFKGAGTVTSVTLKRSGFSNQDALTAVYLYDGMTRLTDGYTFNTAGDLLMNNLNVVVSGSKVLSVKADVASDAYTGGEQTNIIVTLTSYTAGTATAANVQGGDFSFVAGSLAGVTLGTQTVATPSVNAGTANYTIWGNSVSVATRAVKLTGAMFKVIGSAPANSFSNVSLIVDGVKVGNTAVVDAQGNVAFDVSASPVTLNTGTHTVEVRADIVNGASRTFYVSLQKAGDIALVDSTYGVNASFGSFTANNTGTITIGAGTISLTKDTSFDTSVNLTSGASNVAIAKYKLQAYGEDVKVMQVNVIASTTGAGASLGLKNVALYLNGAQVGSSKNQAAGAAAAIAALEFTLGSALIVPAGTTALFEVRADLLTAANAAYTGGIDTNVEIPTDQAQGMTSYDLTEATTPGTTAVTVSTASATLAKTAGFTNQSVAGNTSSVKVGSYVVSAGATEGVRVTNLNVAYTGAANDIEVTDIANLTISLDGGVTKMAPVNPTLASNNFSVDFTVAAGQTKTVDIYNDITAATDGEKIQVKLYATARGASSNISIASTGFASASSITGQEMTVGSGTLGTLTVTANTDTAAQYIVGGTSNRNIIRYNLTSTGGPITVQELTFDIGTSVDGAIVSLAAAGNQGGTTCTAQVIGTTVSMTGCNIAVPQGFGGTDLVVTATFGTVGFNGIASNANALVALDSVKYTNGLTATTYATSTVATSSTMKLVATLPTFTMAGSGVTLSSGQIKVGTITVAANSGGSVNLNVIPLNIVVGGGALIAGSTTVNAIVLKEGNTTVTTTDNITTDEASLAGLITFTNNEIITAGSSKTYDVYVQFMTVTGNDDSVTLSLTPASGLNWDDVAGNGLGLSGTLLSAFPTNSITLND